MATAYIISATALRPARTMANKKSAVTEAEARAREVKFAEAVVITTVATGKEVYRTVVVVPEPAPTAPKAKATPKTTKGAKRYQEPVVSRGKLRPSLDEAPQAGWEVLYDKPRAGYQIWRGEDLHSWALHCCTHGETALYDTMRDAREGVKQRDWCDGCTGTQEAEELLENEVQDELDGQEIDGAHLELLRTIRSGGIVNGAWDPNTAAEGQSLEDMRRLESLGLVELVINDPDNIWVYVTDKGELALDLAPAQA